MSLINDALKKAQKQRTGEAPSLGSMPSVGGESAAQISRRAKPSGFNTLLLRAGLGAAVLLILIVGGYFAFRAKPEPGSGGPASLRAGSGQETIAAGEKNGPQGRGPSSDATAPAANPQVSGLRSQVSEPATVPAPSFTLQIAPKTETTPAKAEVPPPQVSGLRSQVSAPVPVSEPAKPALKLEPRAMTFIENIKVAGIRASASDSKVLMNDRVYRVGDMVEHEMGLKLVGITSNSLTFEDEKGGRFTRTF